MNKAALKRMTRRTEFYMFLVLIILIAVVAVISKGALCPRMSCRTRREGRLCRARGGRAPVGVEGSRIHAVSPPVAPECWGPRALSSAP